MDLNEFKAFAEASELAVRPYKRIVWALIAVLLVFVLLFGGAFYYFMYKAFNTDAAYNIAQNLDNSYGSINSVEK